MKRRVSVAAIILLIVLTVRRQHVEAQIRGEWSTSFQLSTPGRAIADPVIISDDYGYVHVFWVEALADTRHVIQYARFDGQTWSPSVDIRVSNPDVAIYSPTVAIDENNNLHLVWIEGLSGPAYYASAPGHDALNARHWSEPKLVKIPAYRTVLRVDSAGRLHLLYSVTAEQHTSRGVYYIRSRDQGTTWSATRWLDPDIPSGFAPNHIQFEMDEDGHLHALWFYGDVVHASEHDWIRYTQSVDGGRTWSLPFTVSKNGEGVPELSGSSRPVMTVSGKQVHVVWAAGELPYRQHRYSLDAGRTWSETQHIFGELNGQAREDLIGDATGRIHYFGQIRYPQGIYHAYWDGVRWSTPELIYLIRLESGEEVPADIVHAHDTHPAFRSGNEIILTFTDPPPEEARRLFITSRTLDDLAPAPVKPTPTATPVSEATATATPVPPKQTSTPVRFAQDPPRQTPSPSNPIWLGIAPSLLLLGVAVAFITIAKYRHS